MAENKRNTGAVILVISLMIFFFSFIQREKERNIRECPGSSFLISKATISNAQAIIVPVTSGPEIKLFLINNSNGKYTFPDCASGRESFINQQIFSDFCSCRLKFLSEKPPIGLSFLQKIPGQEQNDDPLPIT